jgi:hypothetical protein
MCRECIGSLKCVEPHEQSPLPTGRQAWHSIHAPVGRHPGKGRSLLLDEVARVLIDGGRFCLMEHAKPKKVFTRLLFYVRIFFLRAKDTRKFLMEEGSILGKRFKNITKVMSPTGQPKLIYGEKGG